MNIDQIAKKYKEELKRKTDFYEVIMNEWGVDFFYEKHIEVREDLHAKAMECINKILPPELKIFLKNLCSNKLGYPDEPIFYKAFGDNPEVGQSVSKEELEQKGIDIKEFEEMLNYWAFEENYVSKQSDNGADYYYLESLCERADVTSEEEKERLNASVELKLAIIWQSKLSDDEKEEYIHYVDDLLLGVSPQRLADIKLKKNAKEITALIENGKLQGLSKDAINFFKNIANS